MFYSDKGGAFWVGSGIPENNKFASLALMWAESSLTYPYLGVKRENFPNTQGKMGCQDIRS